MAKSNGLCVWILQVTALFGLLLFFLWLTLRPTDPAYSVLYLSVSGGPGNDTDGDTGNSTTTAAVLFVIEISNDNTDGRIRYGGSNLTMYSGDGAVCIGGATGGAFDQEHERSVQWKGSVEVAEGRRLWQDIAAADGALKLRLRVETVVRHRILAWETRPRGLVVEGVVPLDRYGRIAFNLTNITLRPIRKKKKWRMFNL